MKKKDVIELEITERASLDKTIGIKDGKKVFVKGGLEGELAEVFIRKVRKNRAEGTINRIIRKADYETEPSCPDFGRCGGCSFQNISYEKQLQIKEKHVKSLIDRAGIEYGQFMPIIPSPSDREYRNKMEFSFGDMEKGGQLCLGMHEKGKFHNIVPTRECEIVDSDYRAILNRTMDYFIEKGIPHYNKKTRDGILRHLVIRKAYHTGEILVNLVTVENSEIDTDDYAKALLELNLDGIIVGIINTINNSFSDAVVADRVDTVYGRDYIMEKCLGLDFRISAFSFFQTNTRGSEALYSVVRDMLGTKNNGRILDLYCGTGTITQLVSECADYVTGIEIVEEAVEAARKNSLLNRIDNCSFICGDVLREVEKLEDAYDTIILDPPRAGINPKAIGKIIAFSPDVFIYVSCVPSSLVRDLPEFTEAGYAIQTIQPVDMFPQTGHVETVVLMSKVKE